MLCSVETICRLHAYAYVQKTHTYTHVCVCVVYMYVLHLAWSSEARNKGNVNVLSNLYEIFKRNISNLLNVCPYNTMYILCVYLHIHAVKNTTICQMVSLCNMQHYVIYYMFRPCKWAIIRLFVEPVSWLYHRSWGGAIIRYRIFCLPDCYPKI
jgi:hypothetical protein